MTLTLNGEAIRGTFQAWYAERDGLEAQLNESLSALSAYQSHLDAWQQQLARDRDELTARYEQLERERAATGKNDDEKLAAVVKELNEARDKITALTTLLLTRTEELRALDNRRAEVQTELELSRAREKELKVALDEHKRSVEQERSQYAEELHQLREVLERQLESPAAEVQHAPAAEQPAPVSQPPAAPVTRPQPTGGAARVIPRENAVLGSIVEQFGKLRQQRATDRQANRPR